jgi:hypothetical protein
MTIDLSSTFPSGVLHFLLVALPDLILKHLSTIQVLNHSNHEPRYKKPFISWVEPTYHSRAYCQVQLGACGPILSCQAFNVIVSQGPDPCSSSWYWKPLGAVPGAWVYSKPGDVEVLLWADRWWNLVCPCSSWWEGGSVRIIPGMVVPPLELGVVESYPVWGV